MLSGIQGAASSFLSFASASPNLWESLFKHSFSQAWLAGASGGNMKHGFMSGFASALGSQACKQGFSVGYYNMQKLSLRLKLARVEGTIIRLFDKLAKTDLLILDDFGLAKMDTQQQLDYMEIIEDRHSKKSTIIACQLPVSSWFDVFSDETLADSIIDRIVYTSHRFELKGESLRKKR